MNPRYIESLSWRMAEVYEACVNQILINMARHFPYLKAGQHVGSWDYQVRKLAEMGQVNQETVEIMMQMLGGADEALRANLQAAILDGLKDAEPALRKAAQAGMLNGGTVPKLSLDQMQAFASYYRQSADGLNLVNTVMLESTQAAYAATVADIASRIDKAQGVLNIATGEVIAGTESINQAIRQGVKNMVDIGLTGFIDHGGHHWSPEAYVAMDVRTTMANAAREAVFERNDDYGNDLYQVSWHNGARPLCYPWQGKVISKIDWIRDAEDDEGNPVQVYAQSDTTYGEPAGLFGINCGHYPIPFVSGFSRIRAPKQDEQENDKEYEESQKQRQLERKLRDEKRDLEVMKAQGASEEEIKAQRQRIRQASANLDDFCDETGRARRTSREGSPVRAVWDTPDGPVTRYNGGYVSADGAPPPKGPFNPPPVTPPPPAPPTPPPAPIQVQIQVQPPAPPKQKAPADYGKPVTGIPNKTYQDGVMRRIDDAPEAVRHAWDLAKPNLEEPIFTRPSGMPDAYYSPWEDRVHFKNIGMAFDPDSISEAYSTYFHEYGHYIDATLGITRDEPLFGRSLYREAGDRVIEFARGKLGRQYDVFDLIVEAQSRRGGMGVGAYFRNVLRSSMPADEWRAIRSAMTALGDDPTAWRSVFAERLAGNQEIIEDGRKLILQKIKADTAVRDAFIQSVRSRFTSVERGDISDMFEEFFCDTWGSRSSYPFGAGHGSSYWKKFGSDHEGLAKEAFAEMYAGSMTDSASLKVIKMFFPESYAMFIDMLEGL